MRRHSTTTPRARSRSRFVRTLAATAATALLLSSCGDGSADEAADGAEEAAVDVVDNDFSPDDLEVGTGTSVTWENVGELPHTVTFEDGEDSGDLDPGESYARTFDEAGEYGYVCTLHPAMEATVVVTG